MLPVSIIPSSTPLVGSMIWPTLSQYTWPQLALLAIYVPSGVNKVLVPHLSLSPLWPTIPKRAWRPAGLYEIYAVSSLVLHQRPGWLFAYMGGILASLTVVPHALQQKLGRWGPVGPWCATLSCIALIAFTSPSSYSPVRAFLWSLTGFFVTMCLHVFSPNRKESNFEL
jgi:hypothetical protein